MGTLTELFVLIVLISAVGTSSDENNTSTDHRQARVNGYMNKVYSGTKADPIMCPKEGFLADPVDCSVFYRCIKSYSGKYTVYKFKCGPGTVYDPDTEICNHARSTKRTECGGMQVYNDKNIGNDIGSHELPSPITTNLPTILENKVTQAEINITKYPSAITQIVSSPFYVPERSTTKNNFGLQQSTKTNTYFTTKQSGNDITSRTPSTWTTTLSSRTTSKDMTLITNEQQGDECTKDGFMGDSQNCRKFYRCVNNNHRGFIRYEFLCSELTIWDDDLQSCNHPWAVRRRRCGRGEDSYQFIENNIIPNKTTPQLSYGDKVMDNQKENKIDNNKPQLVTGDKYNVNPDMGDSSNSQVTRSPTNNQQSLQSEIKKPQIQITNDPYIQKQPPQVINLYNKTFIGLIDKEDKYHKTQISLVNYECSENGFIGDANDCRKFYRCVGNGRGMFMKYEFTCSQGTVWDKNLDACNYAWAVKECGGRKQSENDTKDYSKETSTQYFTSSSQPISELDLGYVNHMIDDQKKITTTTTLVPTNENYINNECSSSGFFGDLHDCKIFYRCVENGKGKFIKYVYKCDKDTSWDPTTQSCNYIDKSIFACGKVLDSNKTLPPSKTFDKISTSSTVQFTTIPSLQNNIFESQYSKNSTYKPIYTHSSTKRSINKIDICQSSGFFGDKNDCKKFYRCVDDGNGNFVQHSFTCGEGTVWDANIEACNHAWAVEKCGGSKSTSKESTLHTSTVSYSENEGNGYFTPNNQERPTSAQSTFSNLPTLYTTTRKSVKTTRSTNKNKNECTKSGFKGDNYDCSKFYRCVDNGNGGFSQHEFICGDGTVWDPKIEACNHKWAAEKCGGSEEGNKDLTPTSSTENIMLSNQDTSSSFSTLKIIQTTNIYQTTTSKAIDNVNNNCKFDGFINDKSDCKKYYRCVKKSDGTYMQYEFSCGDGTMWDQEILACTHLTQNQNCGISDVPLTQIPTNSTDDAKLQHTTTTLLTSSSSRPLIPIEQKVTDKNCKSEGFHADPSDCRKFYRCVDNGSGDYMKYEFTCSEGTAWNRRINACDYIYNTDCTNNYMTSDKTPQSTTITVVQQEISETLEENEIPSSNDTNCKSEGFYANPKDCSKFYRCVNDGKGSYVKYDFSCGEGTVWIQESQACDHDTGIANCITSTTTDNISTNKHSTTTRFTTMKTTTIIPMTTSEKHNDESNEEECKSQGFYPHKSNCKMFYRCVDEGNAKYTKYYYTCGEGTAWDTNLHVCNHINEVKRCEMQEMSNHDTQTMPPLQDDQVYSDTNSNSDTTKAPSSSTTETTTLNSNNNTTKPITSTTASSKPPKTDNCKEEGYFGSSSNCKKFYRCVSNENGGFIKYDFDCGEGTIWDQNIIGCNHPENVVNATCKSEDTNEVTTTSSSSSSASSASESSNSNESTSPMSSSQSTSSQSYTESNNESSTKPNNNSYTCTEAGFFADPNDCKKFYRCVDWDNNGERFSIFHFVCGDGTAWDQSLLTCNHEDAVNCSSTQQQSQNTTEEYTTTITETSTTESTTETSTQPSTTTERSTTQSSTTQTPTTEKTTTQKPTTKETTTQTSTTQESTTQTSTTQKPTTTKTTTQKSTTQESTTQSTTTTMTEKSTTSSPTTQTSTEATTSSSTEASTTSETSTQEQTSTTADQTTTTTTTEQMSSSTTQTPDQTTHTDKTTTQESSTEEQQTTEHTTDQTESTTETSSSSKECPETNEDEYLYVCPTSFRRHPKYCNLFYQCTEDDETHESKIATFHCPNNTIYDESKIQCVEEKKADKKCQGEIASRRRVKRLGVNYKEPIIVGKNNMACQAPGHLLFEKSEECSPAFLKCELSKRGNLRGYVYRCPEGYLYWSISRRCEAGRKIKDCKRSLFDWSGRNEIPIEKLNVAP